MPKREQSQRTHDHVYVARAGRESLCCTVFIEEHSFTVKLPAGDVKIGRSPDADIPLVSGAVSRAHARLELKGEHAHVHDLGSHNGTFVNGERMSAPHAIGHGDEITIGDVRLMIFRQSSLPPGVPVVLTREGFVAHVFLETDRAEELARTVHVAAFHFPNRWFESTGARELLSLLPSGTSSGMHNDHVLLVASVTPQNEAAPSFHPLLARVGLVAGSAVGSGSATHAPGMDVRELIDSAMRSALAQPNRPVEESAADEPIVGDAEMARLFEEARRIATSPISVLLTGETGVGKEVFAHVVHAASGRSGPLVCVNTAALPETLLESELFGYERGAFSGAQQPKAGLFEAAQKGTLFLDEIGELPMPMQAKLLRVLEQRAVRRVGSNTERPIDVRIVAATNCHLEALVAEKRFRQDLLFRLNAFTIAIPPLRERPSDIARLAEAFLAQVAAVTKTRVLGIAPEALELLQRHAWPGNVRELRNVIERAAALCGQSSAVVSVEHLPSSLRASRAATNASAAVDVRDSVKDFERQQILKALDEAHGSQARAAEILGLPRRTLTYKLARLGIRVPR